MSKKEIKSIGILTGGGDCPGLNAAIRAALRRAKGKYHYEVAGIRNGWKGLIEGEVIPMGLYAVSGILPRGGTILGTSRTNPFKTPEDVQKLIDNLHRFDIDAIMAIGGDDTLTVAHRLYQERNVPVVGVPKTIDNDINGTDYTFGFDTAVSIATEAIDRLHTTAESHHRVMVIEVMGRHAGWIATMSGIAGGADFILIPEEPFDIDEVCEVLLRRHERKNFSIVVVAEGAKAKDGNLITQGEGVDQFGHVRLGGIGHVLGKEIEKRIKIETRVTILGHIQRGGTPTAYDRVLATRYGVGAVDMIAKGNFGKMVAIVGNQLSSVPLEKAIGTTKTLDPDIYDVAKVFFG